MAGPVVAIEDVAAALLTTVAALLPVIDEAIASGLLVVQGCALVFADASVRGRLLAAIPAPVLGPLREEMKIREPARERLVLAHELTARRVGDQARAEIDRAEAEIAEAKLTRQAGLPDALRARLALHAGDTVEARVLAERSLAKGGTRLARAVLAVAALRAADPAAAARHTELGRSEDIEPELADTYPEWVAFLVAADGLEPGPTLALLDREFAGLAERPDLFLAEPGAAPWLVRLALCAEDPGRAASISTSVAAAAGRITDAPALTVAAAHARALLDRDADALQRIAGQQPDAWAAALASEDLGSVLLGRGRPDDRAAAVDGLRAALSAFCAMGAQREAARVRGALRRLGVRGRPATAQRRGSAGATDPEATGWASLTDIERTIANLVSRGLTNQQASRQVHLSPHTVNYHLRQIFRKLGVRSRVEIARDRPRES